MRLIGTSTSVARREVVRVMRGVSTTLHPRRIALLRAVGRAIDAGELSLAFQPKAALETGEITGCEALLRWDRPGEGTLSPAAFLPVIEDSHVMPALTQHVLEAALDEQVLWAEAGHDVPVQVNLAARDLLDAGFCSRLSDTLARHHVPGSVLGVEITENDLLEDPRRACETVRNLKAIGVTVAIDDFGTGYSSLARLRDLPIDEVKVDRSFVSTMVHDRGNRSIVRATIDLAHDLGPIVVAEGVEDEVTRDALRALGCDREQGYLLGRPMRAPDLRAWLGARAGALMAPAA